MREAANASLAAQRAGAWARWSAVFVVLAGTALLSHSRASRGRFDFEHFYLDAEYAWQHGALNPLLNDPDPARNRQLPFYLPAVSVLIAPIAAGGRPIASVIWAVGQVAALGYCLLVLWRWIKGNAQSRMQNTETGAESWVFCILLLLAMPAIYEASRFNQVSYFTLAALLGGYAALERGRSALSGGLFALAAIIKILPILFAVWLLLKRRFRALAWFCVAFAGLAVVPPLAFFGAERTWQYHLEWLRYNTPGDSADRWLSHADAPDPAEHFSDRRNQSLTAVFGRLFWPGHAHAVQWQPLPLSRSQVVAAANVAALLLLAALLWVTRRPAPMVADGGALWRLRGEFALFALAIQILSPLVRMYYLVWSLPALAVCAWYAAGLGWASLSAEGERRARWGRAGLLIWLLGLAAWPVRNLRECGIHLVMLIGLAVCVHFSSRMRRETGTEEAVREPAAGKAKVRGSPGTIL